MPANPISNATLTQNLVRFGNYRVLNSQRLCQQFENGWLDFSVLMALGMRESFLQNICGGASWNGTEWVQAYTDRGWLQITDTLPENAKWLASVPGCGNGYWSVDRGHKAIEPMHCPRFTDAINYTLHNEFSPNRRQGLQAGVLKKDIIRFCVAAHNAGFTGALKGYRAGNVDQNTTMGDYSAWVLRYAPDIAKWVREHPGWQWHPTRANKIKNWAIGTFTNQK